MLVLVLGALEARCGGSGAASPSSSAATASTTSVEAISLLGTELIAPKLPPDVRARRERELAVARAAFDRDPNDADAQIWLGRRMAYLGRYRAAIAIFTDGIAKHPDDARFYRHRGHRLLTVRRFDDAARDLERATDLVRDRPDATEPDGLPNAQNVPLTTLQSNIAYHLGLAEYLRGRFQPALDAFERCARLVDNPDHVVSTSYWRYLALRRLGRHAEAAALADSIPDDLVLLENRAYHELLLLYKSGRTPTAEGDTDGATIGYGTGMWHLFEGRIDEAERSFRAVVERGAWAAFGAIAAEAELARMRKERPVRR